ncbi:hypothetical protein J2741_000753 [Methanolinea mesophila]|nr:hypothetical protein [Methanolinea mesophila]
MINISKIDEYWWVMVRGRDSVMQEKPMNMSGIGKEVEISGKCGDAGGCA